MPIYEFKCKCGKITEELVKMGTESATCPKCGKKSKKIMSINSFHLKGECWERNGYANKR